MRRLLDTYVWQPFADLLVAAVFAIDRKACDALDITFDTEEDTP